jgi:hypothetical protein
MDSSLVSTLWQNGNSLFLLGAVSLLISLLIGLRWIFGIAHYIKAGRESLLKRPPAKVFYRLLQFLLALVFLTSAAAFFFAGMTVRTYVAFTREDRVGSVECVQWDPVQKTMIVRLVRADRENTQSFTLSGDQWEVSARIIKWAPWANLLGLHTAYRLNQIKGIYQDVADENQRPHQAFAISTGQDWLWWGMDHFNLKIPGVEAVYGNAVSSAAQTGDRFDLLVSTSGLSLKKLKR